MQNTPTLNPAATGPAHAATTPGRRITDAPTRMFHWLFALSFLGAYLSAEGEHWRALHVTLGYTLAGLLTWRVLYGLFGPRQVALGMLWRKLGNAPMWVRSLLRGVSQRSVAGIQWRQGQNLAMALAVVGLLVVALPLTLSGYATYNEWGKVLGGDWIGDVHGFLGDTFLAIVLGHIALIAGLSLLRRKNQAQAMLTGRVEGSGSDLVQHNRGWLAALLLVATLVFGAWQWRQSPDGLIPGPTAGHPASAQAREHDDD